MVELGHQGAAVISKWAMRKYFQDMAGIVYYSLLYDLLFEVFERFSLHVQRIPQSFVNTIQNSGLNLSRWDGALSQVSWCTISTFVRCCTSSGSKDIQFKADKRLTQELCCGEQTYSVGMDPGQGKNSEWISSSLRWSFVEGVLEEVYNDLCLWALVQGTSSKLESFCHLLNGI